MIIKAVCVCVCARTISGLVVSAGICILLAMKKNHQMVAAPQHLKDSSHHDHYDNETLYRSSIQSMVKLLRPLY